jgi:hypothetical protein
LWLAETSQQPISQTTWLKVTPNCNHCNHIHDCALSAHARARVCVSISATTHLRLAATPLSLTEAGTVYSDVLGLLMLHVNMTRRRNRIKGLTQYRVP